MTEEITELKRLIGLTLDRCGFSKSGYSFEFSGMVEGEFLRFKLSTSYCVAFSSHDLVDIDRRFSSEVWDLLEKKVGEVAIDEASLVLSVNFGSSGQLVIWPGDIPPMDNLIILEDLESGVLRPLF